jgi:hypothetical protein
MSNFIGEINLNTREETVSFSNAYKKDEETNNVDSFFENIKNTETQKYSSYTKTTNTLSGSTSNIDPTITQKVLDSLSKDYSKIEELKATDISFDDYKKFDKDSLKVIFQNNPEEKKQALQLLYYSDFTDDDKLNEIYFNSEVKAQNNNKPNDYFLTLGMIAIMKRGNNLEMGMEQTYNPNYTKDGLFSEFDKFKQYYQDTKESWTNNINMSEVFKNMDEIKSLYTQKVEENNAILNSYTRNTNNKYETIEKNNEPVYSDLGKYSEYAKAYNLSQEEIETFKNILEDEKITFKELENLSFEKAEILSNILNDRLQDGKDDSLVTYLKTMDNQHVSDILSSTRMTNNRELNELLYNVAIKTPDESERSTIFHRIQNDLVRTNPNINSNIELAINKNLLDINVDKFLENMYKYHEENLKKALKNSNILPGAIAQFQEKIDVYNNLISNYRNN